MRSLGPGGYAGIEKFNTLIHSKTDDCKKL